MSNEEIVEQSSRNDGNKVRLILGIVLVLGILLLIGLAPRLSGHGPTATTRIDSRPIVDAIRVQAPPSYNEMDLPGNIQAVDQTAVVARASGYVEHWFADIGDQVHAGQTLAIIDTPDLDQQLAQARAQLTSAQSEYVQTAANVEGLRAKLSESKANLARSQANQQEAKTDLVRAQVAVAHAKEAVAQQRAELVQAQTNLNLAHVTAQRYQGMLADGAVDQQSTDQAVASYRTNQANVDAVQSALRAAEQDVKEYQAAVLSSESNLRAYASGVDSSRADVQSASDNIQSGQAIVAAAAANIKSNQANVSRMAVLQSFNKVTAPFTGVITARNIDTGTLISGGGSGGAGSSIGSGSAGATSIGNAAGNGASASGGGSGGQSSLYSIARVDTMRVYINVPQSDMEALRIGQAATVTVTELPGQTFLGMIARTANALDPQSRTLVAEVRLPNPKGILRPGMFAQVRVRIRQAVGVVLIPDAALVTNAGGTQIAVVEPNDCIHYQAVTVGRDFGKTMEITSGLQPGQQIVANANDALREGEHVRASDS